MSKWVLWTVVLSLTLLAVSGPVVALDGDTYTGWGTVTLLEYDDVGPAYYPQVAVDDSGDVIAVWQQQDGFRNHIWSNRYVVGTGWGVAELVETEPLASAVNAQVASDPDGNAVAVWEQVGASVMDIWANTYIVGEGWGDATLIESSDTGSAASPQVCVDDSGNATAVWYQYDGIQYNVWSNRYTVGTGWGSPQLIETDDEGIAQNPQVAVDDSGTVIAVWEQWGGVTMSIWSNRFVVGEGWGTAAVIETESETLARYPQIYSDGSGNAVAVWEQWEGVCMSIFASWYVVGEGWQVAEVIESNNAGDALDPQVTADTAGNAMAVWAQYGVGDPNVWSNRYEAGSGWGTAVPLGTEGSDLVRYSQIGTDGSGNAISVWESWDGAQMDIWSSRYVIGSGWGAPEMILPDNWGSAAYPQVAVDTAGNAVAVWQMYDGLRTSIWSNRYVAPDTTVPMLYINSPSDGAVFETPIVTVSGMTESGVSLSINGVLAAVGSDGSFSCEIALLDGENDITVIASDDSGNSATITISVTYTNPIPALEDQLSDAREELVALQEDLNLTKEDLENATEQLSAVEDELASLRDELDAAEDALADKEDELSDAKSQNLLLMVGLVAFLGLAMLMLVMYLVLRKKTRGAGADETGKDLRPPTDE